MKISFAKEKKKHLQSLNDCKPGWSKEPQWENDCGYFSHSFLLVLSWDQIIFDSMVIVLWHSVNCPLKVEMSIFEWYMVRCGCKGWLTRGSKSLVPSHLRLICATLAVESMEVGTQHFTWIPSPKSQLCYKYLHDNTFWRWGLALVLRVGSSKKLDPTLNIRFMNIFA